MFAAVGRERGTERRQKRSLICQIIVLLLFIGLSASVLADYQPVEWPDLIPEEDLKALQNPPEQITGSEEGGLADAIASKLALAMDPDRELTPYEKALTSSKVKQEYNNKKIRMPGFIVPLEFNQEQRVTEFFLVPFFGACMHLPPPPPNQIVYGKMEQGVELYTLMDAFWIEGTMSTKAVKNETATAAYSMTVDRVEPYYND